MIEYFSMRILGIDYGTKRVGLALTDDKGMMAFPHSVLVNDKDLLLLKIVHKEKGRPDTARPEGRRMLSMQKWKHARPRLRWFAD
jgi:hypothetical protein